MTTPTAPDIAGIIGTAIKVASDTTPRTLQSKAGLIGPSDLGFCRQKAALMAKGSQQTDSRPLWAAAVGTAIHTWVEAALAEAFPTWIIEASRLEATFPNGATVSGTPDLVIPEWNAVLDIKTVDGFEKTKRFGASQNHKFQRHCYALAAIQQGLLDDTKTVYVGNVYLDRSGQETEPYVVLEEFDHALTDEVSSWIDDVIYAVEHNEDASRDIPAPVCERICEHFSACRGELPVSENEVIDTPVLRDAVTLYVEGRDLESRGKKMKEQAKVDLSGLNGIVADYQIRSTSIPESQVPGYTRASGERLDVRKVRAT